MSLHLRGRRLQSDAAAEVVGSVGMNAPADCQLIRRWRIIEADIWDRDHHHRRQSAGFFIDPYLVDDIPFQPRKGRRVSRSRIPGV